MCSLHACLQVFGRAATPATQSYLGRNPALRSELSQPMCKVSAASLARGAGLGPGLGPGLSATGGPAVGGGLEGRASGSGGSNGGGGGGGGGSFMRVSADERYRLFLAVLASGKLEVTHP